MKKILVMAFALAMVIATGGAKAASPLVDVEWVKANLGKPGIVLLDVGGTLGNKKKADYLRAHIPGAIWTDYLKDGWRGTDKNKTVGMLSPTPTLEKLIGGLGIGNDDHVVLIPVGGKALDVGTAARIYWTFKVLGHDNVSILNGGMAAYTKQVDEKTKKPVNPLESGAVEVKAKTFKANVRQDMIISKADVKAAMDSGGVLVDHRPNDQFIGVNKHGKSKRFGTIPGSKNLPENWLTNNGGGMFRDTAELQKLYAMAGVPTTGSQISFCNSGHWASLGWFASSELMGNKDVKMYDGSMIEWTADESMPVQSDFKR
ncbi:MAG: sulfurtransferase [Rhodospirillales bacterium]|nr:sulfurtransferase [Rhodospirillales bacterium]MCW8861672.1 sulfurtransferase [Rhodospirillales bacterium]MCW8951610.1 sulfurtransferase [Rhodospirillales bacterium]MCW9003055.1 sulfurtransferase [Rhodospirillales bacterium]MCW9039622.1 sulfurtransferase [Rhodospirillales bacterium]